MSDEIYEKLEHGDAQFQSVVLLPEHQAHTIIVHGLAKAYSMTGWRIGFMAYPSPRRFGAIQSHSTSNPTSFAQSGAVEAWTDAGQLDEWLGHFSQRRTFACDKLNAIEGVSCVIRGAFYLFPNISGTGM